MSNEIDPTTKYLCNPDVVLREEDEYGGLLFNPDTNQVKIVNTTALFIWKQFGLPNSPLSVAEALMREFEGAPDNEVQKDVNDLLSELVAEGFIGVVNKA